MMMGRSREAALRFAERRRREDEARRLHEEVPRLLALRLEIEEHRGSATFAETKHVRHVIVAHAPSLFEFSCGDPDCRDGVHDLTAGLLERLRAYATDFIVEHACGGSVRAARCDRVVRLRAFAKYT